MSLILHIETSAEYCSVALSENGRELLTLTDQHEFSHAALLTVLIDELLKQTGHAVTALAAIAVSKGPGSYTGLRIGVSSAKGMCYGLSVPLIAVNTLEALAWGAAAAIKPANNELLCPMTDARRMEVYTAIYHHDLSLHEQTAAVVVDQHSFSDVLDRHTVHFFGNGAEKCSTVISHPAARFHTAYTVSAAHLIGPATKAFNRQQFEDLAYFEPFYLKDFIAIKARNKLDTL